MEEQVNRKRTLRVTGRYDQARVADAREAWGHLTALVRDGDSREEIEAARGWFSKTLDRFAT